MNKTAIKNFAIWARNKLIADISYRAGLMGITADGIHPALPQSTGQTKFYDIGTAEPYAISGEAIRQRENLADLIRRKAKDSNYQTAYKYIIEEVAYTWFNRLIAVRFMEVNDYLPSHIRVLSSDQGKIEPDLVTTPFDADLSFTRDEQQAIIDLKNDNKLDELFRLLFIKQCNALNEILPALFEKTNDYTELLLNLSVIDQDGVVYHLVHDIPEEDFDVELGGQVEIIGWLYQYYNTEPKNAAFAKKGKLNKEEIPAATQLFTPDWIVRYMVENSLGRLWVEGHPDDELKARWKYYLKEAEQEPGVQVQLTEIRRNYSKLNPEDIKVIDPCMGSGHILVYAFDVLMQIYESAGYGQRDAAISILEKNLYGLDIDDRAFQMAYFAIMMKARQYNRRILHGDYKPNLYSIQESNDINRKQIKYFGTDLNELEKSNAITQLTRLLDSFNDAKEYGSFLSVDKCDWDLLTRFVSRVNEIGQLSIDEMGVEKTGEQLKMIINQARCLEQKYHVLITNPPYMGTNNMPVPLTEYAKRNFPHNKSDTFAMFIEKSFDFIETIGFSSMVTMQSWMFLSSYEKLREKILEHNTMYTCMHLGENVMGIAFGTVASVISKIHVENYTASYVKILPKELDESDKIHGLSHKMTYRVKSDRFLSIPGSQIAYWVSDALLHDFEIGQPINRFIDTFQGIITGDNEKFLRFWPEVDYDKISLHYANMDDVDLNLKYWIPYNKGGDFRKWYGLQDYIINWKNGPDDKTRGKKGFSKYYLREYVSWSYTVRESIATRYYPNGFLWDVRGSGLMDKADMNYYLEALISSKVGIELFHVINSTISCQVENILQFPIIVSEKYKETVDEIVKMNNRLAMEDWDSFETSWDFIRSPLINNDKNRKSIHISQSFMTWEEECRNRFYQVKKNEERLNRIFISIYGLDQELSPELEDKNITIHLADLHRDVRLLLSYAVGCLFGRYSLDAEGIICGGRQWNKRDYISFIPDDDNIIPITDEEYFKDDMVYRFCEWIKTVFGEKTLEENLDFIANALGNKGNSSREIIRNYFLNDFFKDHCQNYSVSSSGKKPIYWLFDSGEENGFKALIYLHRYSVDTIGNLRIDYLHRMQRVYESEIIRMQDMIDHSYNSREVTQATKRKEKLMKQLKECREYDEKLAHLALSRIELDLDDGVKVNYRKLQTANDGKFYEVLADSKSIMAKK